MPDSAPSRWCEFCPHAVHAVGTKCNQRRPYVDSKHCNCRGKRGFWRGLAAAIGSALGQAKFGD